MEFDQSLMDARDIARLCEKKRIHYVYDRMKLDVNFPRPVKIVRRKGGMKNYWLIADILAWKALDDSRKKDALGRRIGTNGAPMRTAPFAGDDALRFISGHFDPPHAQQARQRRIQRARKNGVTNQPQIRLDGDWQ